MGERLEQEGPSQRMDAGSLSSPLDFSTGQLAPDHGGSTGREQSSQQPPSWIKQRSAQFNQGEVSSQGIAHHPNYQNYMGQGTDDLQAIQGGVNTRNYKPLSQ
mmetsp:Transcript_11681/g.19727  ORF Transcript_11681/g.19727 Transcript_11681/m.19727 type:complete len:103 (+) Transcript_11681:380-688(+)